MKDRTWHYKSRSPASQPGHSVVGLPWPGQIIWVHNIKFIYELDRFRKMIPNWFMNWSDSGIEYHVYQQKQSNCSIVFIFGILWPARQPDWPLQHVMITSYITWQWDILACPWSRSKDSLKKIKLWSGFLKNIKLRVRILSENQALVRLPSK